SGELISDKLEWEKDCTTQVRPSKPQRPKYKP
ncbi:hypothetical protein EVA_02434, partial [gut metagenome]